jgi:hypothetical protein
MIPEELDARDLRRANELAHDWMEEVNAAQHSEICCVPAERLEVERELLGPLPQLRAALGKVVYRTVDKLSCVRFASARYSVPMAHIGAVVEVRVGDGHLSVTHLGVVLAEHLVVAPGETSILDDHYGGPRAKPRRAVRPRTQNEVAFCTLGPVAELFIKRSAAAGMTSLKGDLEVLLRLERAHGREALLRALERAVEFGRFRAHDVESILFAGEDVARPTRVGEALVTQLPVVTSRPLSDYQVKATS